MKQIILTIAASLFMLTSAFAAEPVEYSATVVVKMAGQQSAPTKVYVSTGPVRIDVPGGNFMVVNIWTRTASLVVPANQMYMQQPADIFRIPRAGTTVEGETQRTSMGHEKVNGYDTEKFLITHKTGVKDTDLSSETMLLWISKDNVIVKMATGDESWSLELTDVNVGPQRHDLFDVPTDYKEVDMYGREVPKLKTAPVENFKKGAH